MKIVPDLAIEVVSPNDIVNELKEKLADYRAANIPLVWVVYPELRIIRIHRPGQSAIIELHDADFLTAEPVLFEFKIKVAGLLPAMIAEALAPKPQ